MESSVGLPFFGPPLPSDPETISNLRVKVRLRNESAAQEGRRPTSQSFSASSTCLTRTPASITGFPESLVFFKVDLDRELADATRQSTETVQAQGKAQHVGAIY